MIGFYCLLALMLLPIIMLSLGISIPDVQFTGDNVDLTQKASHETVQRKMQEHHWFHLMAVKILCCG